MQIFCDESGYSGNNLLDNNQKYFVFSAIQISESDAGVIVKELMRINKTQGSELKGANLLQNDKGQRILSEILPQISKKAKMVCHDKTYALACHIFEQFFEPLIWEKSKFYYDIKFHRFIADLFYSEFVKENSTAEKIFSNLFEFVSGNNPKLFTQTNTVRNADLISNALIVIKNNIKAIEEELKNAVKFQKWLLDLSFTSLNSLLIEWGKINDPLDVICDNSKPLIEAAQLLNYNIGKTEHLEAEIFGQLHRVTFTLTEQIKFGNSKSHFGIQIADLFASTLNFCLRNPQSHFSLEMMPILKPCIQHKYSVTPPNLTDGFSFASIHKEILKAMAKASEAPGDFSTNLNKEVIKVITKGKHTF